MDDAIRGLNTGTGLYGGLHICYMGEKCHYGASELRTLKLGYDEVWYTKKEGFFTYGFTGGIIIR